MITIIVQLLLNLLFLNPEAQKTDKGVTVENPGNTTDPTMSTFGGTTTWTEGG